MSSKLLDLVIDTQSPLDEAEIARRVERACDLVEAFADEAALPLRPATGAWYGWLDVATGALA